MKCFLLAAVPFGFGTTVSAEDTKPDGPVALQLLATTDKYQFDSQRRPTEFRSQESADAEPAVPERRLNVGEFLWYSFQRQTPT